MSRIKCRLSLFIVFTAILALGCGQDKPASAIVFGLSNNCNHTGSFMRQSVPEGVADIAIRLSDLTSGKVVKTLRILPADLKKDGLGIGDIQPGNYKMDIVACATDARPVYGTTITNIAVKENMKTRVRAFLPKLESENCVGGENTSPLAPEFSGGGFIDAKLAFACALETDGKYLIFGGFNSISSTGQMKAGTSIWQYLPELGLFVKPESSSIRSLPEPWAAGHCMNMDDGILLTGGVQTGTLAPDNYPGSQLPVMFDSTYKMAKTAIFIDKNGRVIKITLGKGIYPYASVTPLGNNRFMACGGMMPDKSPANTCTVYHENKGTVTNSTPITLNTGRYGHSAIRLKNGKVLLIGGFSPDAADMPLELIDPSKSPTETGPVPPWTVLQSAWMISTDKNDAVLIAGGNEVKSGTPNRINSVQGKASLLEFTGTAYTLKDSKITDLTIKPDTTGRWSMNSLATTGTLSGQPFMAYGFRSFTSQNDADCTGMRVCMPKAVNTLKLDGSELSIEKTFMGTTSGMGATALKLNENSILLAGGIRATSDSYIPMNTSLLISRTPAAYTEICSGK